MDEEARELEAGGKVTVLDRVMDVNLERVVGDPDSTGFSRATTSIPDRDYFVLQGHPNTWDDAKFDKVVKIIDFLIEEKAVFMTPAEYAAIRQKKISRITRIEARASCN